MHSYSSALMASFASDGVPPLVLQNRSTRNAAAALNSHLNFQLGDLDYAGHETSLGPCWGMKWRIGLRTADVFFDSQADELFAAAAAPGKSGIFARSISDNFWGIGPHATLRPAERSALAVDRLWRKKASSRYLANKPFPIS